MNDQHIAQNTRIRVLVRSLYFPQDLGLGDVGPAVGAEGGGGGVAGQLAGAEALHVDHVVRLVGAHHLVAGAGDGGGERVVAGGLAGRGGGGYRSRSVTAGKKPGFIS